MATVMARFNIEAATEVGAGTYTVVIKICEHCNGKGERYVSSYHKRPCSSCDGKGLRGTIKPLPKKREAQP